MRPTKRLWEINKKVNGEERRWGRVSLIYTLFVCSNPSLFFSSVGKREMDGWTVPPKERKVERYICLVQLWRQC